MPSYYVYFNWNMFLLKSQSRYSVWSKWLHTTEQWRIQGLSALTPAPTDTRENVFENRVFWQVEFGSPPCLFCKPPYDLGNLPCRSSGSATVRANCHFENSDIKDCLSSRGWGWGSRGGMLEWGGEVINSNSYVMLLSRRSTCIYGLYGEWNSQQ